MILRNISKYQILLLLSYIVGNHAVMAQTPQISLQDLSGKWYILQSNFPMWLKGDKTMPTFNYELVEKKGKQALFDQVKYLKNGKEKSIIGYDIPLDQQNVKFVWRGKGILGMLKSKWEIVYLDPTKTWAIIKFEKTLFTPAGYDVIARNKNISEELVNQKIKQLALPPLTKIKS